MMVSLDSTIMTWALAFLLFFSAVSIVCGYTDPHDTSAVKKLYTSLGIQIFKLIHIDDPCGPPKWPGVECENGNIIGINLSDANLGGTLNGDLGLFTSIRLIDLSNNYIGGNIPDSLPITLRSLNLSGNSLTHELPSSMGNLSSLTTLYLQNNQFSGTLDVLQNLPLRDLNIENNMFSGSIPPILLSIPNFRSDGNFFGTTAIPSPPEAYPPLSPSDAFSPDLAPSADAPTSVRNEKKKIITWAGIAGLLVLGILASGICIFLSARRRRRLTEKAHDNCKMGVDSVLTDTRKQDWSMKKPFNQVEKVVADGQGNNEASKEEKDQTKTMTGLRYTQLPSEAPPFSHLPPKSIVAHPIISHLRPRKDLSENINSKFFTIASLQQHTDSFSQQNLIGKGTLGSVYRAQLPDGKVLAIKKLDNAASKYLNDMRFLDLVSALSKINHANIVELVGYCVEHGQRLLVYNYCRNGTLNEALIPDDEVNKELSWNARMHLVLQSAKALEYLHEVCRPPIVHRNFKSANVLLDNLDVQVSDCGLSPLLSPTSLTQLQGSGYGAPEVESGNYSCQSDIYSFGVVMLEILTGRKANDSSRPRGEQHLVRWAFSQLHDIDALSSMVDPSLNNAYPTKSLSRFADIISLCIQPEPEFRPPMSEIVQKLLHMIRSDPGVVNLSLE